MHRKYVENKLLTAGSSNSKRRSGFSIPLEKKNFLKVPKCFGLLFYVNCNAFCF
jgi:hypothetical protein